MKQFVGKCPFDMHLGLQKDCLRYVNVWQGRDTPLLIVNKEKYYGINGEMW